MEEKPPLQPLLTHCTLTISDEISSDDGKLHALLTNTLKFKITGVDPLVIEKDYPSPDDIYKLLDTLKDLQHSQNRNNYKAVEHLRDSVELEQKKVNIQCDSSAHKFSLQSLDENRQLTDWSIVNYCEINSSCELASQQAQGSNVDVNALTNTFQGLTVNDVSNDHYRVQEHKEFANNLSGNTLQDLTNVSLENESIACLENVKGAEKQKEHCQDVREEKKGTEKTQPEYFRKQGSVAEHNSTNVQIILNTPTAAQNEIKSSRNHKQKQDDQYIRYSSKYDEELSTDTNTHEMDATPTKLTSGKKNDSQVAKISKEVNEQSNEEEKNDDHKSSCIEQSNRKTTSCIKCDEDAESTNKNIIVTQSVITSEQTLCRQDNATECSSSEVPKIKESERQGNIYKQVHSQVVKTDQGNCGILMTNARTELNPKYISDEMSHIVICQDANISKEMNMQIHTRDTEEDHMISSDSGRNKRKSLKQGDVGASEIFSYTDSSDSDSESTIYSMKASSLDGIKMYFKGSCNDKYFDNVKIDGTVCTFKLTSCEEDVSFLKKLKKVQVVECKFDNKDKIYWNSAVKDIQSQIRNVIVYRNDNKIHIVGLKDSVISAKKMLLDMVTNYKSTGTKTESLDKKSPFTPRNQEKSRISDDDKTDKSGRSQKLDDNEIPLSPDFHILPSSPFEDRYPNLKADKTTYSGDDKHDIFSKSHSIYYVRNERRQLKVHISKADITKLEVDCIVNAANKRLQHGGGVARVISQAAGPALKKECEDFTLFGRQVAVTDIFVSTGGKMPAKCVMHAVGPKWEAYDNKEQCFEDLRHTVVRCLVEADRRGFTSIALPSISAALFKVPKQECARCYMEAVKHFGLFNKEQTSLQDIHFVDVDDTMLTIIQEHFEKNWTKSCDPRIVQEDCDFAKRHIYTGNRNVAKNIEKSHEASKFTLSSVSSTKTQGSSKASSDLGINSEYLIGKYILRTDTRPAFNLPADITITVGEPFDKLSGLRDFSVSSNQKKKEGTKNIYKMYEVSKSKSSKPRKLCALLPEPDDAEAIKQSIGNLETVIQSPNHKMFMETVNNVVLTSSILYSEPNNTPKKDKKNTYDRKKVGDFARYLFNYLQRASGVTAPTITVVGNEDALQIICKVIESRGVKKISPEASTSSHHGGSSRRGDNSDYHQNYSRRNLDDKWYDNEASSSSNNGATGRSSTRGDSSDRQQANSLQYTRSLSGDKQYGSKTSSSSNNGATGRSSTRGDSSDRQQTNSLQYARSLSEDKQYGSKNADSSVDLDTCKICFDQKANYHLGCCGNYLCQDCEKKTANCPYCRRFWRVLIGDQPRGTMAVHALPDSGFWEIKYSFPSGFQEACHPNPGAHYTGMNRTAYLPMNNDGLHVLILLRIAFLRKLTFTIGHSLTTDRENSITWNDIHLKTSLHGGPHGYPDASYFLRVMQELASKGVTFGSISADECAEIDYFENRLRNSGIFADYHPR